MLGERIILQGSTTVAQVLNSWRQTVPFFMEHRMNCIGCPVASFCTLDEVAQHYEMDIQEFVQDLTSLIQA
jgi:hybrid cluster-associated redox disulfide protein